MDPIYEILRPLGVDDNLKAQAWEIANKATNQEDFVRELKSLQLGDDVKAQLWEAKFGQAGPVQGQTAKIEQGPSLLEKIGKVTARELPYAAGTTLGALGGGALGAPAGPAGMFAGGTLGAGVGGAAGEGLTQILQKKFPGLFGKPPGSTQEAIGKIASGANWGATAEAGGQAIGRALPSLLRLNVKPEAAQDLAILEREGVPYTAGDVRPGGAMQHVETLTRGTLMGGEVMKNFDAQQASKLYLFKKRLLDSIGPLVTKDEAGQMMKGAYGERSQQLFGQGGLFDTLYGKFDKIYQQPIDTSQVRAKASKLYGEVAQLVSEGRMPSANSPESPSRFLAMLKDLTTYGQQQAVDPATGAKMMVDKPITYREAWQDKQTIDSIVRGMGDDNLRTRAKAIVQQVHNALDDAMKESALQVSPKAASQIQKVNASYKQAKQLMETESLVKEIPNMDNEAIVRRFFDPGAVTPRRDLMRMLPAGKRDELVPIVRRQTIERLFTEGPHQNVSGPTGVVENIEITSGRMLEKRFYQQYDQLAKTLSQEQMQGMKDFIDASKRAQSSGAMTNPMSGGQVVRWEQVGKFLQFGAGGFALATGQPMESKFLTEGAIFFGPAVLARILTNPKAARFLAKGFDMSAKTAWSIGYAPRVINLIRDAKEKAGEND